MRIDYRKKGVYFFHCVHDAHFNDELFELILIENTIAIRVYWLEHLSEAWQELFMLLELEVKNDLQEIAV